jgi:hypothetical protein
VRLTESTHPATRAPVTHRGHRSPGGPGGGHWLTQMSFQVGMPRVLSSLSPWMREP